MKNIPMDSFISLLDHNEQKYFVLLDKVSKIDSAFIAKEKKVVFFKDRLSRQMYLMYSENGFYKNKRKLLISEIDIDNAKNFTKFDDYKRLAINSPNIKIQMNFITTSTDKEFKKNSPIDMK